MVIKWTDINKDITKTEQINKTKVLFISDSHRWNCSELLKKKSNDSCDVKVVFKPSALLNNVVESVREQTENFRKNDIVLVLGGTNDEKAATYNQSFLSGNG